MPSSSSPAPPDCTEGVARLVPYRASVLAVLSLTFACVALDNTKLVLAVPTLAREIEPLSPQASAAMHWVVESSLVVYASLLLLGGALSERLGARRLLQVGLSCFIAGCLLTAAATSVLGLCAGRAVVGLGGALMVPASLAAVEHMFGGEQRARAVAVWTASFAAAGGLGPLLGGILLERWGSRVLLLGSLPFALLAVLGVSGLVPGSLPRRTAPIDVLGTVLGFGASVCALLGLQAGRHWTFGAGALGAGAALLAALVFWQRRAAHPMLDLELFRRPAFGRTLGAILLAYFAFSGSSFAIAQYLQVVRAHAPSVASWLNLPLPLGMLFGTLGAPRLAQRIGSELALGVSLRVALAGAVLVAVACLVQTDLGLCVALVPFAAGAGSAFANATQMVLSATPPERAGSAAAISETAFEIGGVLGIALLGTRLGGGSSELGASLALTGAAVAIALAALLVRRMARVSPARPTA